MSKIDDILNDMGASLYCLGQDNGDPFKVDEKVDTAKQDIKDFMLELIPADKNYHYHMSEERHAGASAWNTATRIMRQKVEEI